MGLFDAFTGKSQKQAAEGAFQQAQGYYDKALSDFTGTTNRYLDRSLGLFGQLQPTIDTGSDATGLLRTALGLEGPDAQRGFFDSFGADPGFNATLDAGVEALDRSAAARGLLHSGGQQKSLFDFGQRHLTDFYNNRLGSLFNLSNTGNAANLASVTGQSGLISGAGNNIANAILGVGQLNANNAINLGNATAQAESTGINNLLGLGRIAASAALAPFTGGASLLPNLASPPAQSPSGGLFSPQVGRYGRV